MSLSALTLLMITAQCLPHTGALPSREFVQEEQQNVTRPDERDAAGATARPPKSAKSKAADRRRYPMAPDLIIIGLDGKNILLDEKRGKVVIVDFWASWCPPCRRMVPIFNSLQDKYRNLGLEVIGISMDEGTTDDLKELSWEFGVRYTAADGDRETEEAFKVEALPTTILIDRKGRIRARHRGAVSQTKLESEIKKLLSE